MTQLNELIVDQKLDVNDLTGAIDSALKEADSIKNMAQEVIRNLERRSNELALKAETALAKYPLL
jgi:hypothetical protein